MESIARFFYDETKFPDYNKKTENGSQIVDTSFDEFCSDSFHNERHYSVFNMSEFYKDFRCLEIFQFNGEDTNVLENILKKILSKENKIFPNRVSCLDKKYYPLIEDILRKENPKKVLSNGVIEKILGFRQIL